MQYYNLIREAKAKATVRRADTIDHYRRLLHRHVDQRWPWLPRCQRVDVQGLLFYQVSQEQQSMRRERGVCVSTSGGVS